MVVKMKVVHLSTTDYGGAYKAAARISESMVSAGIDSKVIVRTKESKDTNCEEIFHNSLERFWSKAKNVANLLCSKGEVISDYFGTDITKFSFFNEADVIILHWVNSFIPYRVVKKMCELGKPVIWVMHDMWLFTGGCHCDQYCGNYAQGCEQCPMISSSLKKNIAKKNYKNKLEMLNKNIIFVGPSRFIISEGKKSRILADKELINIPNPINTNIYRPLSNVNELRKKYGIITNKKIIMFGAVNSTKDRNKGFQYLIKALELMSEESYMAVVFGNRDNSGMGDIKLETKYLGFIKNEEELVQIYNMADVFVAPSEQDNYSNSVLEALACGVPVTAFNIGGMPELIEHKKNGYIAEFKNIEDLAEGIKFCCQNGGQLKEAARDRVIQINDYNIIGKQYENICKSMIN